MKNKVLKVAVIVLVIMAMTISDFILVGMNIVHAINNINDSTNHENVKFATYFKTEEGKELSQTEYQIDNTDMKLYMQVSVENEGYFDGVITLENSNFKLKQKIFSEEISSIEENTITLNRVRAGNTIEIAVGIEPIIDESYGIDMLSKESIVKITGKYQDSTQKTINIATEKEVALTFSAPSNLETSLEANVITDRIYKIEEKNKRIIQIELNSGVIENAYPIKTSVFELTLPKGLEEVKVISKGTYATNGKSDRVLEGYTLENNTLKITIENENKDGKIAWLKDETDNLIITLMLPEEAEIEEKYTAKSKIEFLGTKEKIIEKVVEYSLAEEADGLIRASIQNKENIYKGKIYSKEDREYCTTTNIEFNYANLIESVSLQEKTTYRTEKESADIVSNTQYKATTISKAEVEKILGAEGILTIKDQSGNIVQEITKDTLTDKNGNILVTYSEGVNGLTIEATKGISTGIIRLNHTKVIKPESYTREEITALNYLIDQVTVKYNTAEYSFESLKQLQETKTLAEVKIDKETLSTATVNEQVKIAITLKTDSEQYDLYKNPTITIKLPNDITKVSNIKAVPLYLDNFSINTFYNSETSEINIKLIGEQAKYNVSNTNGYIEIFADIELLETIPSREDQITLTYTNEKVVGYENNGIISTPINISGFSGLVAFNKITNYGLKTNSVNSKEEQIGNLKMYQDEAEANFELALVNNTDTDLKNVKVIGNLPVQGNTTVGDYTFENTVAATLKTPINLEVNSSIIYYTNNAKATLDLGNTENGWKVNLAEVSNPVLYMVVIPYMAKETNLVFNYTMNIPANLEYDKQMRTTYVAYYETELSDVTVKAKPVGLETGKVQATLEATVGTGSLENNSTVKSGEVIKYKITVVNTGSNEAKNVKISALVPEGTVFVEPVKAIEMEDELVEDGFEHAGEIYYKEIETTTVEKTIETLSSKESITFEYEVRVKNDINKENIENQATITYGDSIEVKSNILANKLEEGNIRVTVKRVAYTEGLMPGAVGQYYVIVENISDVEQKNINMKFNIPTQDILTLTHIEEFGKEVLETKNEWTIDSIPAGEYRVYNLFLELEKIKFGKLEEQLNAVATQNNIQYRSNVYTETLYGFDLEMKMTSTNEGEYLKTNDIIEYQIEIKNNSQIPIGIMFEDNIPEQLSIQKIEIDGNIRQENLLDNKINIVLDINENSTITIKIFTIVDYDRARLENETITNIAKVLYAGEELASTQSVSHIIESIVIKEESDKPSENPDNPPVDPENPENPEQPDNSETPNNPEKPQEKKKFNISGKAWVDQDKDGEMNNEDTILESIKVKLLNIETNEFVRNENNTKDLVVKTNKEGYYEFENIIEGKYIVVFEYDKTLYKPTAYQKENVAESKNSNVVSKALTVNGEEKEYATTNEISLNSNISNVNMGLVFVKQFDVKLDKYISKVIVQTSKDTTTYDYENEDFAKVDINAKRIVGSTILVQYTIKVTNIGDVDAYVNSIVDYLPTGFKFSSELNTAWYQNEADLYTSCLENTAIAPGESKEVNLTLTKTKTDGNAELINNMAEVHDAYNIYGISDTNSEVANKNKEENDFGSADLMISIQTGTVFNYIALVISMLGVIGAAVYLINKKVLRIKL